MAKSIENDGEFRQVVVAKVEGDRERGWWITDAEGWAFGVPKDSPVEPKAGMVARFYGEGLGRIVRGLTLDGAVVFYRTAEEQEAKNAAELVESERREREAAEAARPEMERRYAALPPIFQRRIDKFRRNNPEFWWKFERYEMFTCEQAVVIADALGTADAVREFYRLDWAEQKARVPGLDSGHSGNTFGMACRLAMDYLAAPENVEARHGALAPLVGSEEYGCVPKGNP